MNLSIFSNPVELNNVPKRIGIEVSSSDSDDQIWVCQWDKAEHCDAFCHRGFIDPVDHGSWNLIVQVELHPRNRINTKDIDFMLEFRNKFLIKYWYSAMKCAIESPAN